MLHSTSGRIFPTIRCLRKIFSLTAPSVNDRLPQFHSSAKLVKEHIGSFYAHGSPIHISSKTDAYEIVHFLKSSERQILLEVLQERAKVENGEVEKSSNAAMKDNLSPPSAPTMISREQMRSIFIFNTIPFIGFGILDNGIMIVAGEYIDSTLGVMLGISTMAAAGFGNIISDIAGVGSAHWIEYLASKMGLKPPLIEPEQWDSSRARWSSNLGRAFGLMVGCLIGMSPLLLYDETEKQEQKLRVKHEQHETLSVSVAGNQEKSSDVPKSPIASAK